MVKAADIAAFIILAITRYHSVAQSCTSHKFEKTEGMELAGFALKTIDRTLFQLCWDECAWLPWCFSINVRTVHDGVSFECDLNNSTKMEVGSLVPKAGSDYYEMTDLDIMTNCKSCKKLIKQVFRDGWYRLNAMLYKFFSTKMNWTEAVDYCRSIGGNLVRINDYYLDTFIYNLLDKDAMKPANILDGVHWALDGTENDVILQSEEHSNTKARYQTVDGQTVLYLTGQYSYVDIPATKLFNGISYTMMMWVKIHPNQIDPTTNVKPTIFSDIQAVRRTFRIFYLQYDTDGSPLEFIRFRVFRNGIDFITNFDTPRYSFPKNVWNHLAVTLEGINGDTEFKVKIFINGTESMSGLHRSSPPRPDPRPFYQLGVAYKDWKINEYNLKGHVKDLRMFNRTLNVDEIKQLSGHIKAGSWIGFSSLTNTSKMGWSDGSDDKSYTPLPGYDRDAVLEKPSCTAISRNGKWTSRNCGEKKPFVCQKPVH